MLAGECLALILTDCSSTCTARHLNHQQHNILTLHHWLVDDDDDVFSYGRCGPPTAILCVSMVCVWPVYTVCRRGMGMACLLLVSMLVISMVTWLSTLLTAMALTL